MHGVMESICYVISLRVPCYSLVFRSNQVSDKLAGKIAENCASQIYRLLIF